MQLNTREDVSRFIAKVSKSEGCWHWKGKPNDKGYGCFYQDGKSYRAHRVSYEHFTQKEIPQGLVIDHLCRNRICVRPDHLEPVTILENVKRGTSQSVVHSNQTHCTNGHPFDLANTQERVGTNGRKWRDCRQCSRERQMKFKASHPNYKKEWRARRSTHHLH